MLPVVRYGGSDTASRRYANGDPGICVVGGCVSRISQSGLCAKHFQRSIRGVPLLEPTSRDKSVEARFWEKVDRNGGAPANPHTAVAGQCWIWTAAQRSKHHPGYGAFRYKGKQQLAHRVAWQMVRGEIPDGLVLDHLCRRPACVNPDHLETTDQGSNVRRSLTKTHCKRGHELAGDNLYHHKGGRACRLCRAEAARRRYLALSARDRMVP